MTTKTLGAPAQYSQPSRKGKKSWRKHVDIGEIEAGLDSFRDEERITGTQLHKKTNDQLFHIDVKGDEKLKRSIPKYDRSRLMSTRVLVRRSSIPPVLSRASSGASKHHRSKITHEDKHRLLRIGKRNAKGPFNALIDPTELGAGSAILEPTEAVKKSGTYDVWSDTRDQSLVKVNPNYKGPEDFLLPSMSRPKIKAPTKFLPHRSIELPAVAHPHQGTSYNPTLAAHNELLLMAHKVEQRREFEASKFAHDKERIEFLRRNSCNETDHGAPGMLVDDGETSIDYENNIDKPEESIVPTSKTPARKTQKQRRRAAQLLAEKRALLERRSKRRFLGAISSARSLRLQVTSSLCSRQAALAARRAARAERLRLQGFIGRRLGKHRVEEAKVDVQLREELSESLRGVKLQGNLFRDRFLSLQHRALVEPRVPVAHKHGKSGLKEYEKHAWKRFE